MVGRMASVEKVESVDAVAPTSIELRPRDVERYRRRIVIAIVAAKVDIIQFECVTTFAS